MLPQVRTVASVRFESAMPHSCRSEVLKEHSSRDASVPSQSTDARPTGRLATNTCTVTQLIVLLDLQMCALFKVRDVWLGRHAPQFAATRAR